MTEDIGQFIDLCHLCFIRAVILFLHYYYTKRVNATCDHT